MSQILTAVPVARSLSSLRPATLLLVSSLPTMVVASAVFVGGMGSGHMLVGDWPGYALLCSLWWALTLPVTFLAGSAFLRASGVTDAVAARAGAATVAAASAAPLLWAGTQSGPSWVHALLVVGACGAVKVSFVVARRTNGVVALLLAAFVLLRVGALAVTGMI